MARRNTTIITCKLGEAEVTVAGTYYPGTFGTYEDPPDPAMFEIDSVEYDTRDISAKLTEAALDALADKCLEEVASFDCD